MPEEENPWLAAADAADEEGYNAPGTPDGGEGEDWTETVEVIDEEPEYVDEEPDIVSDLNFQLDGRTFDAALEAADDIGMTPEELIEASLRKYLREGNWL